MLKQAERLSYSTVRLCASNMIGSSSTGTGFLYSFLSNGDTYVPAILTNKHVIDDMDILDVDFSLISKDGNPNSRKRFQCKVVDFHQGVIRHPDPNVDLCAITMDPIIALAKAAGGEFYIHYYHNDILPTQAQLDAMDAVEEVLMVGYPNGIWDSYNNQPIFRRGITATNPKLDYEGKREFLVDASVYPGSSGSPIVMYNKGFVKDELDRVLVNSKEPSVLLMGIVSSVYLHHIGLNTVNTGETIANVQSSIPNNLGIVIKAERIRELEELVAKSLPKL